MEERKQMPKGMPIVRNAILFMIERKGYLCFYLVVLLTASLV